jgi:hypothetical protein
VPKTFAPARVYGGWRMVLDSLCFRQIWPPHTKAAAVSGSVRHLSRVRVTYSGHGRNETANSAAATAGRRTYARPGGFQVAATTGGPEAGCSLQDSRRAPAPSVWPAVADGSPAEHAPQATVGIGRAEQRTRGPPGGGPSGCRAPSVFNAESSANRTRTKDVLRRQQRPVRTGSAVSQYKQPPEGGPTPGPADFHVCQARQAGPWDFTVAGQPGRTATSVHQSPLQSASD